ESAGIDPGRYPGAIGLYGGVTASSYLISNLLAHPAILREVGAGPLLQGTDRDFLTTQVSYRLGLRGPSVDVQTACSTSLVAAHLACQALLTGDCDVALAGGVSIKVPQRSGYVYQESGPDSSDGHCRAFDAKADGSIYGAGVGLVVLKRLEDAVADGDPIHAVILGSALNNDGSQKVGYTAPSIEGQAAVVAAALDRAGVEPGTIDYVECHGSGTALGDPIEVTALSRAFGDTGEKGSCALGSVKTNIGHLGAAAGVAGLIKTVLALEHGEIPPSLNFETPNPKIDFARSPFRVNDRLSPWPARGSRRAGVNSLGQGGTNAHVVLEEAPPREPSGPSRPWQLLVLSARTETALEAATDNLAAWLEKNQDASLADAAFTLQVGRRAFPWRRALVCRDGDEARRILAERDPRRLLTGREDGGRRPVAFLLSGVGDHYPGMARQLYATEPVFRAALDRCFAILADDLREVFFAGGERAAEGGLDLRRMLGRGEADEAARRIHRTLYAQPAVFAVEYALAQLWISWGVLPEALLGYSLGEYVAACLAGVFSLEDALPLVAERARWIEELPAGSMLAVPLSEDETRGRLTPGLDLAAVNGPQLCVVSGPPEEVAALARRLEEEGIAARQLPTTHAFHSRGMEPLAARLTERVARLRPAAPRIPLLSNVTGTWLTAGEATDPGYWARHLCGPVRFSDGLTELWKHPSRVLLEVGPGQGLSALALQHPDAGRGRIALPSLPHAHERQDDAAFLFGTLGRLWLAGAAVDWAGLWREERRLRLELPLYPFERRRFWVEAPHLASTPAEKQQAPAPTGLSVYERPSLPRPWVAPRNATETWIAGQIERLLGIAGVGAHDSFFELG
ncbi:MAG TPA: acyltransferase domain-containing protein, partial [Thermoanaerobaculia bacterium]|nr:acyltransferase domain-containing protein [Thermoanaerobaculia bacterium]